MTDPIDAYNEGLRQLWADLAACDPPIRSRQRPGQISRQLPTFAARHDAEPVGVPESVDAAAPARSVEAADRADEPASSGPAASGPVDLARYRRSRRSGPARKIAASEEAG